MEWRLKIKKLLYQLEFLGRMWRNCCASLQRFLWSRSLLVIWTIFIFHDDHPLCPQTWQYLHSNWWSLFILELLFTACCRRLTSWRCNYATFCFSADDLWLLSVCGRLPVCLHPASPQGAAGCAPPPHPAMLWFQVRASTHPLQPINTQNNTIYLYWHTKRKLQSEHNPA